MSDDEVTFTEITRWMSGCTPYQVLIATKGARSEEHRFDAGEVTQEHRAAAEAELRARFT